MFPTIHLQHWPYSLIRSDLFFFHVYNYATERTSSGIFTEIYKDALLLTLRGIKIIFSAMLSVSELNKLNAFIATNPTAEIPSAVHLAFNKMI